MKNLQQDLSNMDPELKDLNSFSDYEKNEYNSYKYNSSYNYYDAELGFRQSHDYDDEF